MRQYPNFNDRVAWLTGLAESWGATALRTDRPFTGAPIAAFRDRLDRVLGQADVVYNLSCFAKERDTYGFRALLLENYWDPLIGSETAIGAINDWFADNPRVGLAFAPPASAVGRISRAAPLCPRASNWTFEVYPGDLARASSQSRWPWRGNAAFSGRLARSEAFAARLGKLHGQSKHEADFRLCGLEGFIPEIARQEGFAPGLVVTAAQAAKLVARGSAEEAEARRDAAALAETFTTQKEGLRRQLELATAKTAAGSLQAKVASPAPAVRSAPPAAGNAAASLANNSAPAKAPPSRPTAKSADPGPSRLSPAAPRAIPDMPPTVALAHPASPANGASMPAAAEAAVSEPAVAPLGTARPTPKPALAEHVPPPRLFAGGSGHPAEAQLSPSSFAAALAHGATPTGERHALSPAEVCKTPDAPPTGSATATAQPSGEPPEAALAPGKARSAPNGFDHAGSSAIGGERPPDTPEAHTENLVPQGGESPIEFAFRMTPNRLRFSHRLQPDGDTAVLTIAKGVERHAPVTVELGTFAYGGIAAFERKNAMLVVKGWCFDSARPDARVYVASLLKSGVLSQFRPCVLPRAGLARKSHEPIPHENCGFSLTVPDLGDAGVKLVLANDEAEIVQLVELQAGSIFGR